MLLYILYHFLKSCFRHQTAGNTRRPGSGGPWFTSNTGWFSGFRPDDSHNDPPPPYSKYGNRTTPDQAWQPGFWTGAALGGLGAYLFSNNSNNRRETPTATTYDWERERARIPHVSPMVNPGYGPSYVSPRRSFFDSDDRGEGPSSLGSMRRSTGLGGSNVR